MLAIALLPLVLAAVVLSVLATRSHRHSGPRYDEACKELYRILGAIRLSGIGLPQELRHKNDAYLFITIGAHYSKVSMLSVDVPSTRLTSILNAAAQDAGLSPSSAGSRLWDRYCVADVAISDPVYGARSATNTVRVGRLIHSIRSRGLRPYVLLRIPNYTTSIPLDLPRLDRPRYVWYDATRADAGLRACVRAEVPFGLVVFLTFVRFILPAAGGAAFAAGIVFGLRRRLPPRERVDRFDVLALGIPMAVGLMALPMALAFDESAFKRVVADIWLGTASRELIFVSSYIACAVLAFGLPVLGFLFRYLVLRRLDEEPSVPEVALLVARAAHTGRWAIGILATMSLYVIVARTYEVLSWMQFLTFVPMVMGPAVSFAVLWIAVRSMFRRGESDAGLTARAKELAHRLGVDVREVRLVVTKYGKRNANALADIKRNTILVTQKAADCMASTELDFLLAHELAHFRDRSVRFGLLRPLRLLSLATGLAPFVTLCAHAYTRSLVALWLPGVSVACFAVLVYVTSEIPPALEYEADRQAMIALRDPDAACAALTALAASSCNPKMHDRDMPTHPRVSKRIKALRQAAAELGISTAPVEQDA